MEFAICRVANEGGIAAVMTSIMTRPNILSYRGQMVTGENDIVKRRTEPQSGCERSLILRE